MRTHTLAATLGVVIVSAVGIARAAPTMGSTKLPVDLQLIQALDARGMTQGQIDDFVATLVGIELYDDHANPTDTPARSDRTRTKIYYTGPYFTPSRARSVVGAEQFATSALTLLDDTDILMNSFAFRAAERLRLVREQLLVQATISAITRALSNPQLPPMERQSLLDLLTTKQAELQKIAAEIANLNQEGTSGAGQLVPSLRQEISDLIILTLSRLGVLPTTEELSLINSLVPTNWVQGLAQLRARAGDGQLGLRQVIFESGLTPPQLSALSLYLQLRPDVVLRGLTMQGVLVRPVATTLVDPELETITRTPAMQFRGVNLGNGGTCGSTRSCNVIMEYTDTGSRDSVKLTGTVLVPVTFEGDVRVQEPDFVGSVHCHFKTGWMAQGRADVRDGAIIYDGDLSNKIKYDSTDDEHGGCDFVVQEGSLDSAFYHTLWALNDYYIKLHTQRQQAAKEEKDAYRARIEEELLRHQRNSQTRQRGGWFSDVFGVFMGGRFFLGVAGFLIGGARDFYWHTTELDTANFDEINVSQTFTVRNTTILRRFTFDGLAIACHEQTLGGPKIIRACSDEELEDPNTEPDEGNEDCPTGIPPTLCGL